MIKKSSVFFTLSLFMWFTLDMTGIKIKNCILVESALLSGDGIWWLIFLTGLILLFYKRKVGVIYLLIYYFLWIVLQYFMTFQFIIFPDKSKIENYNHYFEKTHHFIKPSNEILVLDTYHTILFCLLFLAFVTMLLYCFKLRKTI